MRRSARGRRSRETAAHLGLSVGAMRIIDFHRRVKIYNTLDLKILFRVVTGMCSPSAVSIALSASTRRAVSEVSEAAPPSPVGVDESSAEAGVPPRKRRAEALSPRMLHGDAKRAKYRWRGSVTVVSTRSLSNSSERASG